MRKVLEASDEGAKNPSPVSQTQEEVWMTCLRTKKNVYRLKGRGLVKNQLVISPRGRDWGFLCHYAYTPNHKGIGIVLFHFPKYSTCSLLLSQTCWAQIYPTWFNQLWNRRDLLVYSLMGCADILEDHLWVKLHCFTIQTSLNRV